MQPTSTLFTLSTLAVLALACFNEASAATAAEWKNRTIYQLLTDRFAESNDPNSDAACGDLHSYCGGNFQGIIDNLDYIQGMGFDAIWISPVVKNNNDPYSYHGYWASDLYSINPNFGSSEDLQRLVEACHQRNMYVMVDVVANHMGTMNSYSDNEFQSFYPFNISNYFHYPCNINYNDQGSIEYCRLGDPGSSLIDLNTENPAVVSGLYSWIEWLVSTYGFDGIRIDTVKHVRKTFWSGFVKSAGVFSTGEVFNGDPTYVGDYQNYIDAPLHYPLYYTLNNVYKNKQSMWGLETARSQTLSNFKDPSVLTLFLDNHDNPRFLNNQPDWTLLKNGLTYILMSQGIPIVYYGTEQAYSGGNDPYCRETLWPNLSTESLFYQYLAQVNSFRKAAGESFFNSAHQQVWTKDYIHVFLRGSIIVVTTNVGSGNGFTESMTIPYANANVKNIFDGTVYNIKNGQLTLTVTNGQPMILIPF